MFFLNFISCTNEHSNNKLKNSDVHLIMDTSNFRNEEHKNDSLINEVDSTFITDPAYNEITFYLKHGRLDLYSGDLIGIYENDSVCQRTHFVDSTPHFRTIRSKVNCARSSAKYDIESKVLVLYDSVDLNCNSIVKYGRGVEFTNVSNELPKYLLDKMK